MSSRQTDGTKTTAAAARSLIKNTQEPDPSQLPKSFQMQNTAGITQTISMYENQIARIVRDPALAKSLVTVMATIVSRNQALKECTPASIVGGLLTASILRLNLEPSLGHCYLIPRYNKYIQRKEANFQIGYKGYISLLYRNSRIEKVYGSVARENDDFEYQEGTEPFIRHRPKTNGIRGDMKYAYAYAVLAPPPGSRPDSERQKVLLVMDKEEVMKHKNFSQASDAKESPWNYRSETGASEGDWEQAMWIKTAMRQLTNQLPISPEMAIGLQTDNHSVRDDMFSEGGKLNTLELDAPNFAPDPKPAGQDITPKPEPEKAPAAAPAEKPEAPPQEAARRAPEPQDEPLPAEAGPKPPPAHVPGENLAKDLYDKILEVMKTLNLTQAQFKEKCGRYSMDPQAKDITQAQMRQYIKNMNTWLSYHTGSAR
jgi:recombination protein RecT